MAYALPGIREALSVAIVIRSVDKFSRTFGLAAQGVGGMRQKYGALIGTISTLFDPMTILLAGIMAVTAACIKATQAAAEFEYQMVEIRKVYQGNADDIDNMLIPAIKGIGETYGLTANEVTQSMVKWAQQGRQGIELQELTEQAIRLTMVTMIDEAHATEYLTAAINQFGLSVDDTAHIIAVWNHLGNTQMVTAAYLAQALVDCGASAAAYGVTIDQASTYLTLLSRAGFQAGQAGKGLRMIFEKIFSQKGMKSLARVGILVQDANGDFKDADDILTELAGKWDGLSDSQRKNVGEAIAGNRHIVKLNLLMKDFTDTTVMLASETDMLDSVEAEVARTLDTAQKQWDITKSKMHNLSMEIGNYFLPVSKLVAIDIGTWVTAINDALPSFNDMRAGFTNVKDEIAKYIVAIIGEDGQGGATGALYDWLVASGYIEKQLEDEEEQVEDTTHAWYEYGNVIYMAGTVSERQGVLQKGWQGKMKYWNPILAEITTNLATLLDLVGLGSLLWDEHDKKTADARQGYLNVLEVLSPITYALQMINWQLEHMIWCLEQLQPLWAWQNKYGGTRKYSPEEEEEREEKKTPKWLENFMGILTGRRPMGGPIDRPGLYMLGDTSVPEEVKHVHQDYGGITINIHGGYSGDPKKLAEEVMKQFKYKMRGRGTF